MDFPASGRLKAQEGFSTALLALKTKGQQAKECRSPLEAENDLWLTASKDRGPQRDNFRELNSANNLNDAGSRFFSRVSNSPDQSTS